MPDTPPVDVADSIAAHLKNTEPGPGGCCLWLGPFAQNGQPALHEEAGTYRLSREIYIAHYEPIAKHWQVEAWCGQPRCVNPYHLRQVLKANACKPIVGVPLPKGESLKSAGYKLVHRPLGVSVWEPADIAKAINEVRSGAVCEACGAPFTNPRKMFCNSECERVAHKARRLSGSKAARNPEAASPGELLPAG